MRAGDGLGVVLTAPPGSLGKAREEGPLTIRWGTSTSGAWQHGPTHRPLPLLPPPPRVPPRKSHAACFHKHKLSCVSGRLSPQASVERARALSLEGEKLIDSKHYAVDSIRPKCHELQHLCDQFAAEVERRRGLLGKSLELHSLLEAVSPMPTPSCSRVAHSFPVDRSHGLEVGPARCCLWAFLEPQPVTAARFLEFPCHN